MTGRLSIYVTAVFVFLSLCGCGKDKLSSQDMDGKKDVFMELALCVDRMGPLTRLTEAQETSIRDVLVLVFEKDAQGDFVFGYIPETVGWSDGMLRLKMRAEVVDIRVAILANLDLEQTGGEVFQDGVKVVGSGEDIETAFDDILFDCTEQALKNGWKDNAFPMWWMMEESVRLEPGMDLFYGSIWLLRAVSKVNLLNVAEEFVLVEAYVYNCLKQGKTVPFLKNVYTYDLDGKNGPVADKPSLPSSVEKHGLVRLDASVQIVSGGQKIADAIYLPEAAAPSRTDKDGNMYPCHPDATCLVVGGKYDGSDRITYYRIDITVPVSGGNASSTITSTDYSDVVRNGRYDITITEVRSEGSATPESALGNRADIGGIIEAWQKGPDAGMVVE